MGSRPSPVTIMVTPPTGNNNEPQSYDKLLSSSSNYHNDQNNNHETSTTPPTLHIKQQSSSSQALNQPDVIARPQQSNNKPVYHGLGSVPVELDDENDEFFNGDLEDENGNGSGGGGGGGGYDAKQTTHVYDHHDHEDPGGKRKKRLTIYGYRLNQIKWFNVAWLIGCHVLAVVAYTYVTLNPVMFFTAFWTIVMGACAGFGGGCGAHRLYAHKSFKAHWLLRLALVFIETLSMNGGCYSYARDHRCHHKFVDTNGDPKNAKRGFFFAHIGWWMVAKHPMVLKQGKKLDYSDLDADWMIVWQKRLYKPLFLLIGVIMPTVVPIVVWGEEPLTAFFMAAVLRAVVVMHHLFTVNSIAHIWGLRPYNAHIGPTESKITMYLSMGEGSHNYHHTFPYDYRNSDKQWWEVFNPLTLFLDITEKLGLASDLKKPSRAVIDGLVKRNGDPCFYEQKLFRVRPLWWRVVKGIFEWSKGITFLLWAYYFPILFKIVTGRPFIVFDGWSWTPFEGGLI